MFESLKKTKTAEPEEGLPEGKEDASHLERLDTVNTVASRPDRIRNHFVKFWVWYTLASVIFLAIFLPIFFKIAIPAIAQRTLDDTPLSVKKAQLLDPTPDSISVSLDTILDIPLKATTIKTDPFTLELFNRATKPRTPYLNLDLPKYTLRGTSSLQISEDNAPFASQTEFMKVLSSALHSREFQLSARGSTKGHISGALHSDLTLDKNVKLEGLDDLRGWSIDSIGILPNPEPDGTNARGTVTLPNHSVIEFDLGNVTFNLFSGDLQVGYVHIDHAFLTSGDNQFPLYGFLDLPVLIQNLGKVLGDQRQHIKNGDLLISVMGNSTVYNGQHLTYYEEVFKTTNLSTLLPLSRLIQGTGKNLMNGGEGASLGDIVKQLDLKLTELTSGMSGTSNLGSLANSLGSGGS